MSEPRIDPRIQDRRQRCADARARIDRAIEDSFIHEGLTRLEMLQVLVALVHARATVAKNIEHTRLLEET